MTLRRLAWIIASAATLTGIVWATARVLPGQDKIMFVHSDGRRELVPPPPELTRLRPEQTHSNVAFGTPKLVLSILMLATMAGIGRRAMTWRRTQDSDAGSSLSRIFRPTRS